MAAVMAVQVDWGWSKTRKMAKGVDLILLLIWRGEMAMEGVEPVWS
jgi:hypothetical protein